MGAQSSMSTPLLSMAMASQAWCLPLWSCPRLSFPPPMLPLDSWGDTHMDMLVWDLDMLDSLSVDMLASPLAWDSRLLLLLLLPRLLWLRLRNKALPRLETVSSSILDRSPPGIAQILTTSIGQS